jgi:hypothetical protein
VRALQICGDCSCDGFPAFTGFAHSLTPECGAQALNEFADWWRLFTETRPDLAINSNNKLAPLNYRT